jgi:hypothetical protein
MAVVPFRETAVAHWNDEVERARHEVLASLDDLRAKTDSYLTVSALATTLFAVLAPGPRTNGSVPEPVIDPRSETTPRREPRPLARHANAVSHIALRSPGNGVGSYPDERPDLCGRPSSWAGHLRPPESAAARAITSPNRTVGTVGVPLSFSVTTTGVPVPAITSKGALPGSLTFMNNGDGTATIGGTPRAAGVFHFTVRSRFGKHADKYIVMQSFTLTVRG